MLLPRGAGKDFVHANSRRRDSKIKFGAITGYPEIGWITFYGGLLWWCFVKPGVIRHQDGRGTYRETVNGWRNTDVNGGKLLSEKLSGNLLKVQAFQGTICEIKAFEYLKRKLNGQLLPEVDDASQAENQMVQKIVPLRAASTAPEEPAPTTMSS